MSHPARRILAVEAQFPCYWGVDIGGTNIKIGLVDSTGGTVAFESIPTREADGGQAAVNRVAEVIRRNESSLGVTKSDVPRIGLGSPGTMDLRRGLLVEPPNLPHWFHFAIRAAFENALDRPVTFLNDANSAAYGEFWLGAGRDHPSMAMLTLGTGVGGGVIVDGALINGVNSSGSECGHIVVDSRDDAELCVWGGGKGHLEAYASASAVVMRTRRRLQSGAISRLVDSEQLTSKDIYLAAEAGDRFANDVIDDVARWLGIGITSLVHVVDPGLVVLGGAMDFGGNRSPVGQRFIRNIYTEFVSRTFSNVAQGTIIQFATLGGDAGYLGAAGYAKKEHENA